MAHQFKKKFGQNFLHDKKFIVEMVDSLELKPTDIVLEIGPGDGSVTNEVLSRGNKIICIEIDYSLLPNLVRRFSDNPNFNLVHEDILKFDLREFLKEKDLSGDLKLVGSLPYNISKMIIAKYLKYNFKNIEYGISNVAKPMIHDSGIKKMSFIVQDEVAKDYVSRIPKASFLYNFVKIYSNPKKLRSIPAEKFYPKPKVDGGIITFTLKNEPEVKDPESFVKFMRVGFSSPRKSLKNNLKPFKNLKLPEKFSENQRAQELEFEDWVEFYKLNFEE